VLPIPGARLSRRDIYFIVTDRFCDGDPANNTGKSRDFDASKTDWWKYWGGDLQGILDKLDYLQGLGASAIWITPVFDQVDRLVPVGEVQMAPYHGYWAKDFRRIDEHLVESPDDVRIFSRDQTVFDRLVGAMHERGMKMVLDIVCNHSNPQSGGGRGELYDDGKLLASFDQDYGGWYRRLGGVEDWNDLNQVQTRDLCGLADFNEETHEFRTSRTR
jgi:cyclomaltodextrin glucanotransferase